jgi:hypothetical protein
VVSERLDRLIQDEVQRTYLETDDGYWADLVLSEFGFLEEREGRLDAIAFHQKGDYIRYSGRWGTVVLEFMPDNYPEGRWIEASARLRGAARTFEGSLDSLIGETKLDPPRPTLAPVDRETIRANVHAWAEALRSAVDLF